ncbi:TRAP transporter large permease [bacterium 210917-SL.2.15]|nr:TRAP transporter large permease [bacterium 210917-SL.2.15]
MTMAVIVVLVLLVAFMLFGVPVGFAIGGATMAAMWLCSDLNMVVNAQYCYSGIFSFTVMAIPFFMLAGVIMSTGGIARRIVDFASALIGFVAGSLGCVTILACMFFGALCGSGMATASAIGSMMIPEMKKKGYDVPYATTVVCFAAIVGPIIPPSLSFVLYGAATKTSVPDLFRAGILPGILIGVLFILMNIFLCRRHGWDLRQKSVQAQADAEKVLTKEEQKALMRRAMKERLHMIWNTFKDGFWALLSPVIILGGIYSGIFTPTEAACVSVVYSIFASMFIYKEMGKRELFQTFLAASVLNGVTSFLLGYSTVFSTFMTFEQVPQMISHFLTTVSNNPIIILLLINAILLVIGLFLDTVPAIIVMAPLLLPTVQSLGIDPIQFGVIMSVNLAIGLCSPPYGCNLFVGAAVAKIKMESMLKWIVPYFVLAIIALMLITFVEPLSMFLVG